MYRKFPVKSVFYVEINYGYESVIKNRGNRARSNTRNNSKQKSP